MDHPLSNGKSSNLENFNLISINQTNSGEVANNNLTLQEGEINKKSKIKSTVNMQ